MSFLPPFPNINVDTNSFTFKGWFQSLWKFLQGTMNVGEVQTASFIPDASIYFYACDSTAGAIVVTLPPASDALGKKYTISHATGANTVTIALSGSDTLVPAAATTVALSTSVTFMSDGVSIWYTSSSYGAGGGGGGSVPTGTGFYHVTAGAMDAASKKVDLSTATDVTGVLLTAGMPALTGDITTPGASLATTLATVNANVGSFTNTSLTVNAKGLITAASSGASAGNLKGQEFTAGGTFTTSANTTGLWLTMIGGGGGGNGGVAAATGGNGGGAGEHVIGLFVAVAASTAYTVTIGAGGAGIASNAAAGDGGATSFGSLTSVAGGRGAGTALATQSGAGGGPRGGAVVARGNPGLAGLIGTQESAVHFGGSSGGSGGTTTASAGGIGGSGGPNLGGAAGTAAATQAGGGGGASTFYGKGGAAGNGGANGSNAPAGSYGAAGGGGGGAAATTTGGNGLAGYCLVQWVE